VYVLFELYSVACGAVDHGMVQGYDSQIVNSFLSCAFENNFSRAVVEEREVLDSLVNNGYYKVAKKGQHSTNEMMSNYFNTVKKYRDNPELVYQGYWG
jgi:hypothetical protein